jgi:hypothetical protein
MKQFVNLAKPDPIGWHGVDAVFVVGTQFERPGDRIGEDCGRFGSWIGEGMSVVAVVLPPIDKGGAPVEEIGVAVAEESGEETVEIRMELGAPRPRIDRKGEKSAMTKKIGDGRWVGRKWRKVECTFWSSGAATPRRYRDPNIIDHYGPLLLQQTQEGRCEKALAPALCKRTRRGGV